jgi:hypothetical protein
VTGGRSAWELRHLDQVADFESTRERALTVACPRCEAEPGDRCVYPGTDVPHPAPAHWQRIRAADQTDPTTHPEDGAAP